MPRNTRLRRAAAGLLVLGCLSVFSLRADEPAIHSITVGDPPYPTADKSSGDTWMAAWAPDGTLYSPANDTNGFNKAGSSNVDINRIDGDDPRHLTGETINLMAEYGRGNASKPDSCTWKSCGFTSVNGVLYLVVCRAEYGDANGDIYKRQPSHNATIIKSTDGGKTWTPSAQQSFDKPEFGGTTFGAPYFINYGQDGHEAVADSSDKYVYATSNDGFWDNGSYMVLARCLRSDMPKLEGGTWSYYTGGDGSLDSSWNKGRQHARRILQDYDALGETGATYLPSWKSYVMVCWYYPGGGGKMPDAHTRTIWNFRVAPHPWGPWRSVGTHEFSPAGYYCPGICPKFSSADGKKAWVFCAGDWTNGAVYRLTSVPITIQ